MTQFAGALRAQLNLQVDTENTQSVSPNSTSEFLSKAVSSLDLSGAEYGTLLLKDKLHDQAYAYSVVRIKQHHLSSLNTYIQNVQDVDILMSPSSDEAYAARLKNLQTVKINIQYVGSLFHTSGLDVSTIINPNLGDNNRTKQ